MKYPEITSFENGILVWNKIDEAVLLRVDGKVISDKRDGLYHGDRIDLRKHGGALVELSFININGAGTLRLVVDFYHRRVRLAPVDCGFDPATGELGWNAACGALGYCVIDIDYGVKRIRGTRYEMWAAKYAVGVLPVSDSDVVGDAEIRDIDKIKNLKYLDGAGTADDPYRIRTAYDLRAIDYYEARYAEALRIGAAEHVNHYRIEHDINYGEIAAGDEESNISALAKPFYGVLDGNGKKLTNIRVRYDRGYWALFDFIARGATVKNIRFVRPEISNSVKSPSHPTAAEIATIANRNYGTISNITVKSAHYSASGGEVCGVCSHNYGTVEGCSVSGTFVQENSKLVSQACYEMAGVVIENRAGARVEDCTAVSVTVRGTSCTGRNGETYYNVRTAAGIVAVNRAGGVVARNAFSEVMLTNVNTDFEFGGLVAYNAGTVITGGAKLGKLKCNGADCAAAIGKAGALVGTVVGKNDGAAE